MQMPARTFAAILVGLALAAPAVAQREGLPAAPPGGDEVVGGPTGAGPAPPGRADVVPPKVWIEPGPEAGPRETLANPYEGDRRAIQEGERLYEWYNCVGCHAPEGGGGMGPPLSDSEWIYGDEPLSIFRSVWEGRPDGMPTFADMIPEEQLWKLVAYVQTLHRKKSSGGE